MKAICFLAVLVLAVHSSPLNHVHELYRGFVSNLPMGIHLKNDIMNSGLECLHSSENVIMNLLVSLQRDIQGKHFIEALKDIILADDLLEHKTAPQCLMTYQQIVMFFMENQGKYRPEMNPEYALSFFFSAKMIQSIARIIEDLVLVRPFNAGEKIADYFSFQLGLIPADFPQVIERDFDYYHPYDENRSFDEYIPGFLNEFGASQLQVNSSIACVKDLVNVTTRAFNNPNLHRGDRLTAMTAFLEGALMMTESVDRCYRTVHFDGAERVLGLFMKYPVQFVLKFYVNTALEKLSIAEIEWNHDSYLFKGDYASAGKNLANLVKISLKDIAF